MTEQITNMMTRLKRYLDKDRYDHTLGVMHTAGCLAMRYDEDMESALTAGLLHDCAKCIPNRDKLKLCKKYGLSVSETERSNPGLLHAKLGAYLAYSKYHVTDREILNAIAWHTTGRPNMTLLDKIIYIADYIEPGRAVAPNLPEVRKLAFVDIDKCLCRILEDSCIFLKKKGAVIDTLTEKTYLYYQKTKGEHEICSH